MGMYTAMADQSQVKRVFGVEVEHMDQYCIVRKAEEIPESQVDKIYRKIEQEYSSIEVPRNVMNRSIRIYLALKKIKQEQKFDFLAIKCQPELIDNYTSACLANSLLADEGIISSCECDINGALTMQILRFFQNLR